ncbi:hypothetical protein G7Y79_00034g069290 [Physcia stellaris]|nr:hypothetical protein G7Y79_00034g069290 [Physcia stellaris]
MEFTSLPPNHRWRSRSPSLGPPPATPPTPHDPRLDTSPGPPPATHDPRLDTDSGTPPPPPRARARGRRRTRPQARPQAVPASAPPTANITDPMSKIYNPPSPDFNAFERRFKYRIMIPPRDPCPKSEVYSRSVAASLADVHKQVAEKTALAAYRIFDDAVKREGRMIKLALGGNRRRKVMHLCHHKCAEATCNRDERKLMRGLAMVWRKAVDDEVRLEELRARNRRRHWNAVSAMIGQKTLGWSMRIRRLKAKGRRDARKLRTVRKAGAGTERTEAGRRGSLAGGGDSGYESDDSWTDSSSGKSIMLKRNRDTDIDVE